MDAERYRAFTDHLVRWAERDDEVVGLVAVGSMADVTRRPDEWSDHDVWVVVGADPAPLRSDSSWLPDRDRILMVYAESEHGRNVIYDDGHLIEYAVLAEDELEMVAANEYRVLVDKADIAGGMLAIVTATQYRRRPADAATLFGRFVGQLVIGLNRYGRGETLSAEGVIKGRAMEILLTLLAVAVPPETDVPLDNLDPRRRFELAYPSLGAALAEVTSMPAVEATQRMLDHAGAHLQGVPGNTPELRLAISRLIDRVVAAWGDGSPPAGPGRR